MIKRKSRNGTLLQPLLHNRMIQRNFIHPGSHAWRIKLLEIQKSKRGRFKVVQTCSIVPLSMRPC